MSGNFTLFLKHIGKSANSKLLFRPLSISSHVRKNADSEVLKIGVQGAGFDRGQPKPGVEKGPQIIRSSGFIEFLRQEVGHDIKDYGDINFGLEPRASGKSSGSAKSASLRNLEDVAKANNLISENTKKILQDKRICVTLGGDHSIAIGSVHGASEVHDDLAVLWVDAHCDINTANSTPSGNIHGMSLAFLLEELKSEMQNIPEFSWVKPRIKAANLAYIGLRSVDPGEREILDRLGITSFDMHEVDHLGILEVTRKALEKISPGKKRPLHISFDIDSLDDLEVGTTTGTPVPGGLTVREGMVLLEEVREKANIVSMDLVEVNPSLGEVSAQKRTAEIAKHLFGSIFGYKRRGLSSPQQ